MSRDSLSNFLSLWAPAATMLLVSFISYVDRNTPALLAPTILEETRLTAEQYGLVISAFSAAHMIGNPLWGRALDVWGVRWASARERPFPAGYLIWRAINRRG